MGWQEVVGTSGTIRAVDQVSRELGLNRDWLSGESFPLIDQWLIDRGRSELLDLVTERRRPVFAGGYAIISAIFDALSLQRLDCASGALREGVLYDLNGRLQNHDSRDQGVDALVERFGLDRQQGERIRHTAIGLLHQVQDAWDIGQVIHRKLLAWAGDLHEIGTTIAFNQHHKHGAYIIENSDIDGFSRRQQRLLGLLVRSHRQKFPTELFETLSLLSRQRIFRLAVLLRLSVALNRGRSNNALADVGLETMKDGLRVHIDGPWCDQHPLTLMDLQAEQEYLSAAGFNLELITPDRALID